MMTTATIFTHFLIQGAETPQGLSRLKQFCRHENIEIIYTDQQNITLSSPFSPSQTLGILRNSNFPAILRGVQGLGNETAVSVLEHFKDMKKDWIQFSNRGVSRFIQTFQDTCMIDLSFNGLPDTYYTIAIHIFGDLSNGITSTGHVYESIGETKTDSRGMGFFIEEVKFQLSYCIGRSLVIHNPQDVICGIVARSAGIYENYKTVCACSGKTVWEESRAKI